MPALKKTAVKTKQNTPGTAFIPGVIFLFLCSLYLFTMQGVPIHGDPEAMYLVASGLATRGSVALAENADVPLELGRNGGYYAKFGLGQSLVEVPAVWFARRVVARDAEPQYKYYIAYLFAVGTVAVISALCALMTYFLARLLGAQVRGAAAIALLYGIATMAWPYSKFGFSEPLQSAMLLVAVYSCIKYSRGVSPAGILFWALACGCAAGFLVVVKAVNIILVPFFAAYVIMQRPASTTAGGGTARGLSSSPAGRAGAFAIPLLIWFSIALFYNWLRFGGLLDFGYTTGFDAAFGFSTPLLSGLYGLLFSPGKSVFLYSPIVIAGIACAPAFHKKFPRESLLIWGMSAVVILFYSKWWAWHGDTSWGPRFMLPCIPLMLLPLSTAIGGFRSWRKATKVFFVLLAAASVYVQILGATVNFSEYAQITTHQVQYNVFYIQGQKQLRDGSLAEHFIPEFSPVAGHAWLLKHTLLAFIGYEQPPFTEMKNDFPWRDLTRYAAPPAPERALGLDFWHRYYGEPGFQPGAESWAAPARDVLAATCFVSLMVLLFLLKKPKRTER